MPPLYEPSSFIFFPTYAVFVSACLAGGKTENCAVLHSPHYYSSFACWLFPFLFWPPAGENEEEEERGFFALRPKSIPLLAPIRASSPHFQKGGPLGGLLTQNRARGCPRAPPPLPEIKSNE